MSIVIASEVKEAQLWPQGDIRDPLGVWGSRVIVPADATGGSIKTNIFVPALRSHAFIYTAYSANISLVSGVVSAAIQIRCRLLSGWPDLDPTVGIQGYGSNFHMNMGAGDLSMTAPIQGPILERLVEGNERFILLFDPRARATDMDIMSLEYAENTPGDVLAFESYGYYWDRSVLDAPGGPRHPGSS